MMTGKTREYNWRDIVRLIQADCGLTSEQDIRSLSETWFVGGFAPPENDKTTIIRNIVYDKPYGERLKDHCEERRT